MTSRAHCGSRLYPCCALREVNLPVWDDPKALTIQIVFNADAVAAYDAQPAFLSPRRPCRREALS